MMIWAWQKANPHYVVMTDEAARKVQLAPTACSSWTSPKLDQSVKYGCKNTLSEQVQPDKMSSWRESMLAAEAF